MKMRFIRTFKVCKPDGYVATKSIESIEICEHRERDFPTLFYVSAISRRCNYNLSKLFEKREDAEKVMLNLADKLNGLVDE
jgi:hypothetical protein